MNKLILTVTILLLFLTACGKDSSNDVTDTTLKTNAQTKAHIINLSKMNISSIKIKDLNTHEEIILTKGGIIREFCDFLTNLHFSKTDYTLSMGYEAEVFDREDSILKIRLGDMAVGFSEKVILGDSVIEKGDYQVSEWISHYIQHFYEGTVLDPEKIEASSKITTPDEILFMDLIDKGNTRINTYEVYSKIYSFAKENFCSRKFEVLESKKIADYESMNEQKQDAIKSSRAISIQNPFMDIKIDSGDQYDKLISAPSILLVEHAQKPGIYKLFTEKMIIDIKVDNNFVKGFNEVFSTNTKVSKVLTPSEIEELFNEKKPYYWDYIWKNLGIEGWYADEFISLEKFQMSLNIKGEPYNVLGFYYYGALRLLFFKVDKYIDYIDFGGKMAGTDYRLEKAGDKVFIVGKSCRGYGTGMSRYFEDWYTLTDKGKKLVVSLPYDDFDQGPVGGYNLKAQSIKLHTNGDITLTADYLLKKFYMSIDIGDEAFGVNIEVPKKVVFNWDVEKSAFVSEFPPNDMGMTEIPPESEEIKEKCTYILKNKYHKLTEAMLSLDKETDTYLKENMKKSWELFLNDCENCDEKSELFEMLKNIQ